MQVLAYKFLRPDRRSPLTGFQWPESGWVEADGPIGWCHNGVHACRVEHLPHWLGPELWVVELDGELLESVDAVIARRGQLRRRVETWSAGAVLRQRVRPAGRASALANDDPAAAARACDAVADAAAGWVSAAAYIAAAVAGEVASGSRRGAVYEHYFLNERCRQSWWLADRLALTDG
jgi:hypothetical protein